MLKRLALTAAAISILSQTLTGVAFAKSAPVVDPYMCHGQVATIIGTEGDDELYGTDEPDVIVGLGGNDLLKGFGSDDVMCGGAGSDDMYGHWGNDTMYGGADNDSLEGNADSDTLYLGGTGSYDPEWKNELQSGNIACGDCLQYPGDVAGDDVIIGGSGADGCMTSGTYEGAWWISGGPGNDYIDLKGGNDCAYGDGGDDTILGGSGDDMMGGSAGLDTIHGNAGFNLCTAEVLSKCS
jgi:Ca2+-binding RTX toxin-like protein